MPAAPDYAPSLAASGRRRPPQRATFKNSRLGFFGAPSGRTLAKRRSACRTAPGYRRCGYKTASGRPEWLSRDPMGEYGGLNLYGYVRDNPVNMRDPLGLCPNDPKKKCGNTDPMSSSAPNPYSPGDNYLGVDAGMMFSIGGNNSWGQLVRSCLVCMLKGGASMGEAHSFCYLNSEKRVGFWRGLGGFLYAVGAAGATAQYQSGPMPNPLHP